MLKKKLNFKKYLYKSINVNLFKVEINIIIFIQTFSFYIF